jgi:hypothetical protein
MQIEMETPSLDEERVRAAFCRIADNKSGYWYELELVGSRWRVRCLGTGAKWWATIRGESVIFDKEG